MKIICRMFAVLLLSGAAFAQAAPSTSQSQYVANASEAAAKAAVPAFPEVDASIANNVYTNRFFGMSVALPAEWRQLDWNILVGLMKERVKDDTNAAYVNAAANMTDPKKGLMLLTTTPTDGSGPLMMIMTVELGEDAKAVRAEDFLVLATMPLIQNKFTMTMKPEPLKIGDKEFSRAELLGPDQKTTEAMIFTITKNHVLGFIIAGTEDGKARGYEILKSVKFSDTTSPKQQTEDNAKN